MSINNYYDYYPDALRRRVITEYVAQHNRSPTKEQIFELMQAEAIKYPQLNKLGFSSYDIEVPFFGTSSSATEHNKNHHAIRDDLIIIGNKFDDLAKIMESSYRAFLCTANRCHKLNSSIDAKLNNLLLLSGRTDVFVHGIEESFDTDENINKEKSTVQVNPGYVTLGRDKYLKEDSKDLKLKATGYAMDGVINSFQKTTLRNLLDDDGKDWVYWVQTNNRVGEVSCILEVDMNRSKGRTVGSVKLTGSPMDTHSEMSYTIFYSLNGTDYSPIEPRHRKFYKGENLVDLGLEGVMSLKIVLTKTAADWQEGPSWITCFQLDSIELLKNDYTIKKESTLIAGPYEIVDDMGKPVNFTMATLAHGTCCIVPEKTSISFFLSKNGSNWFPCSYTMDANSTIQFASSTPENPALIDQDADFPESLIGDPNKVVRWDVNFDFGEEALTNVFIPYQDAEKFVLQNCFLKRNTKQGDKNLYGVQTGWFRDESSLQVRTTLYIDSFEGTNLNLGSTSAFINGKLVTGEILLPRGYHTFSTTFNNWYDVPVGLDDVAVLKENDPAYPFNHKLLIEGYPYAPSFQGERVYNGLGSENFGELLKYVTPERFANKEFDKDLSIYTVEEYNGNLFFKVKIDPSDASWKDEKISVNYMLRQSETNKIYVKALLKTRDTSITPNINKFQVRVI